MKLASGGGSRFFSWMRRNLWIVLSLLGIQVVYVWFATAGNWELPAYISSYERLAQAFLAGHVHLLDPPHPELLKKADPYSVANSRYWMVDLSLWNGHYYLYWGPVPALILALVKWVSGAKGVLGEAGLALFFVSVAGLASALLVAQLWRRLFPRVPRPLVFLAMLAAAFVSPGLHLLTTGNTYVVAIAGGQAFLVVGLLLAFEAIWSQRNWGVWLACASLSWGLGIGCRASLAPAMGVMALLAGCLVHSPTKKNIGRTVGALVCTLGPLGVLSAAQLWYNWVRFESVFEFGTNLQTGFFKFSFHAKYLLVNLYTYALRPPAVSCHFPYFLQEWFPKGGLPFKPPDGYLINEPVVGLVWAVPAMFLAPLGLWPFRRFWRGLGSRSVRAAIFTLAATLACVPLALTVPFGLYMATIRYQGDAIYALILLGVFGYFALWTRTTFWTKILRFVGTLLIVQTIAAGLALGYQGYNGHVHVMNHKLDRQLRRLFSFCDRGTPVPRFLPNGNMNMD